MAYAALMHAGLPTGTPTAPDSAQRSGAPSIDATGPNSGDDPTIPLVEVVMRRDRLAGDPAFALEPPPPYHLRDHRPGDAAAWVHIHRLAEPFHDVDEALYQREFGAGPEAEALLRARQLFLCDAAGDAIGTATAWPPQPGVDPRLGRVHWVAIAPPHQGRGLMRPLMAALCRRFPVYGP